jgi:hypothetical protein
MPGELCRLALKYDTDKCPQWHGGTGHSYTPFYEELLKGKKIESVLEIGICSNDTAGSGPSLQMWNDYFPKAEIYGIDNCPWVMRNIGRIRSFEVDQSSTDDLELFVKCGLTFDLIVDDGSHQVEDQILSANMLVKILNPGGLYIIEDVAHGQKELLLQGLKYPAEIVELDIKRRPDDRLAIIRG